MRSRMRNRLGPLWHGSTSTLVLALETTLLAGTASAGVPEQVTNIFKPLSTPAELISEVAWPRAGRLRRDFPRRRRAARLHHRPLPPPCPGRRCGTAPDLR